MKIIGIEGSFRTEMGWIFPTHEDFKLITFTQAKQMDLNKIDAFIQTNVLGRFKNSMIDHFKLMDKFKKPRIVIEQAPFRKNLDFDKPETCYYKVGLNHFTWNEGIFYNKNSPSDRWERIQKEQNIEIKPWRQDRYDDSKYILFLLQNPIDTSLNSLTMDYTDWIIQTIKRIKTITKKKIKIRLHPRFLKKFDAVKFLKEGVAVSKNYHGWNKSHGGKSLYEDFKNTWACVTFSSNAATEAVCEGIPVINLDNSSFSWPVSYHTLDILNNSIIKCDFDRTQWLYDCAYTQWTMKEINSGIVHKRLLNVNLSAIH